MDDLDLAHRLDAIEAQSSIRNVKAAYMEGCDLKIGIGLAELFAPNGTWEGIGRFALAAGPLRGRRAIADHFSASQNELSFSAHYLTNEAIEVNGSTAVGKWMFLQPAVSVKLGAVWIAGRYRNDFVKHDGHWLIEHLRCQDLFIATHQDGWAELPCLDLGWGIADH